MIKQVIICDSCRAEIAEPDLTITWKGRDQQIHFCEKCSPGVQSAIMAYLEGKPETVEAPKKTGRKSNIDWNKACALKLAGWPNAKIADELHCSSGTIDTLIAQKLRVYEAARKEDIDE